MSGDNVVVLPTREEMERRLIDVDDNAHLRERFYPLLLASAGQERVAPGVALMMAFAIEQYSKGMPPGMRRLMYLRAPEFVTALVDDQAVATTAQGILASTAP